MTVVGVTGHSNLTPDALEPVRRALRDHLRPLRTGLVGVSCIARGADQVFADVVLELGGALEVVLPAADYLARIPDPVDRERCDAYLASARSVLTTGRPASGAAAYLAGSLLVLDRCEELVAVWDGRLSGGTAEAVGRARELGVPTTVLWPAGARRG
ncbi:hypothetical protein [Pseudonocardia sp. NPDC046786]|uniref:hypothetical protein n=1 Tax=Pseudonocardia sp. NPDC046786 TaxID=3155471 RepID=UPI0034060E9A